MTFLLLQAVNVLLAASTLWIRFRNPGLWDDQAMVFSTVAGTVLASLTAVLLGASMVLAGEIRRSHILHLLLTLLFAGLQGAMLYITGRDLGIIHLIKSRLGGA